MGTGSPTCTHPLSHISTHTHRSLCTCLLVSSYEYIHTYIYMYVCIYSSINHDTLCVHSHRTLIGGHQLPLGSNYGICAGSCSQAIGSREQERGGRGALGPQGRFLSCLFGSHQPFREPREVRPCQVSRILVGELSSVAFQKEGMA